MVTDRMTDLAFVTSTLAESLDFLRRCLGPGRMFDASLSREPDQDDQRRQLWTTDSKALASRPERRVAQPNCPLSSEGDVDPSNDRRSAFKPSTLRCHIG